MRRQLRDESFLLRDRTGEIQHFAYFPTKIQVPAISNSLDAGSVIINHVSEQSQVIGHGPLATNQVGEFDESGEAMKELARTIQQEVVLRVKEAEIDISEDDSDELQIYDLNVDNMSR